MAKAKADRKLHGPGSLKDGWNKLARDLDRAIALAALGPNETLILQVVREGCWVIPSARKKVPDGEATLATPCRVHLSALARNVERSRESLSRAQKGLVSAKILDRCEGEDGLVVINKDYTKWVRADANGEALGPLFSANQLKYIWAGKQLTTAQPSCDRSVTPPVTDQSHPCDRSVTPPVTDQSHLPIEDRARGIRELEREREKSPLTPQGGDGEGDVSRNGRRGGRGRVPAGLRLDQQIQRQREVFRLRREQEAREEARRGEEA